MIKNSGLRLAKRIVLGKNKPTPLLRFLSWGTIIWSTICALFLLGTGIFELMFESKDNSQININNLPSKFLFIYAFTHLISILSGILLYRLKKIGFYLYFLSNITMVVLPTFYIGEKVNYFIVSITLIIIGLFTTQWKKLS